VRFLAALVFIWIFALPTLTAYTAGSIKSGAFRPPQGTTATHPVGQIIFI